MDFSFKPRPIVALLLVAMILILSGPAVAQDAAHESLDGAFCHPLVDPTCEAVFTDEDDFVFLCDPASEPDCESSSLTIDQLFIIDDLFNDPATGEPRNAVASVLTRTDLSDDLQVDQLDPWSIGAVAAGRLIYAIDALAEIGAFAPDEDPELNAFLDDFRDQVPSDGMTTADYTAELNRFAADFPTLIAELEALGTRSSPETIFVEEAILDPSFARVASATSDDTAILEPIDWLVALADLVARRGATAQNDVEEESIPDSVLAALSLFQARTTTVAEPNSVEADAVVDQSAGEEEAAPTASAVAESGSAVTSEASETDDPGLSLPLMLVIAGVAVALLVGALVRRSRRASLLPPEPVAPEPAAPPKLSLHDLVDASRHMTASLDAATIAAIALEEAKRMVSAEGGLVIRRVNGSMVVAHLDPARFFDIDGIDRGSLQRVTETGRSIVAIASDEPVLVEVPMAMAAVPIVTEGHVNGALLVVRMPSQPFDRSDLDALEMLAPLIGSSFKSASAHDSATELMDIEPLTGLKNRRCLDRDLEGLSGDHQAAYVMLDVDHFKNFNDVNGHAAGDEALRRIARLLEESVRPGDVVYRYGGEEFCVLLGGASSEDAYAVAERARAAVERATIAGGENQPGGRVTISVGVADTRTGSPSDLIERADAALYAAKHDGRNRVAVSQTS